jgi:hypothetical protein
MNLLLAARISAVMTETITSMYPTTARLVSVTRVKRTTTLRTRGSARLVDDGAEEVRE